MTCQGHYEIKPPIYEEFIKKNKYEQNWIRCTQTQLWLPLLTDSNHKQSDEVIKASVQVINYKNVKPKSVKWIGFLK
jgi:hypothetical protein